MCDQCFPVDDCPSECRGVSPSDTRPEGVCAPSSASPYGRDSNDIPTGLPAEHRPCAGILCRHPVHATVLHPGQVKLDAAQASDLRRQLDEATGLLAEATGRVTALEEALVSAAQQFELLSADIGSRIGDHQADSGHDHKQRVVLRIMRDTANNAALTAARALLQATEGRVPHGR